MKKFLKIEKYIIGILLCLLIICVNFMPQMQALRQIENGSSLYNAEELLKLLSGELPISVCDKNNMPVSQNTSETLFDVQGKSEVTIKFCGIPVKTVSIKKQENIMLMPGGQSIGVRMHTFGALIVGFGDVFMNNSKTIRPAEKAGLKVGDIVIEINDTKIENAQNVIDMCNVKDNSSVLVKVIRNGETLSFNIKPIFDINDKEYKLGMWVRDSTVGIGTLSFYKMSDKKFGALGHAILDTDTGSLLVAENGDIVSAQVTGINKGSHGTPGELLGTFSNASQKLGNISENRSNGLYGTMYEDFKNPIYSNGLEAACIAEIQAGKATILSTIDINGICEYECEIIKIYKDNIRSEKDMVIQITDERLIEKTGGIVQGMSGSPIIQNGKIVGAVTHVLVNDPTRGYGIFIENMLEASG